MSDADKLEEELFGTALSLPAHEREHYLTQACDGSPSLRARLTALLRIVDTGRTFNNRPFMMPAEVVGDRVDSYQLLQELGEGGCGVVYRAEQVIPVRREVALKIIKLGIDSKAVIARFEAERQVLARMDHPNIARVLNAGATASGRPYFVMELVRGVRITDYCNQVRLSIPDRVTLFMQVCQAIQHAHYKGVVHRDIKPSNVMVTLVDGAPVVKVIDFGIAKATQGRLTEETLLTAMEQFMGTPAYVSPEQTEPGNSLVDTRSDVYSLGVLLYELIAGCLPFDSGQSSRTGVANLRERIRSEEPNSPSARLTKLDGAALEVTANRCRVSTTRLVQQVRGDLDWIVLHCLEKEQKHRYQTANDLLSDLQRHIRDEPVLARPHGVAYALAKFARRHRVAVATAAAFAVVLISTAVVTTSMAVRLTRTNRVTQDLNNYLRSALTARAAWQVGGFSMARVELGNSASMIPVGLRVPPGQQFAYDQLTEASVHLTLAASYRSLRDTANELLQLEMAAAIYRKAGGLSLARRTEGAIVRLLSRQGLYEQAKTRASKEETVPPTETDLAVTLSFVYFKLGEFAQAKAMLEPLVEGKKNHRDVRADMRFQALEAMAILAEIYAIEGRASEAEGLATVVLKERLERYGRAHAETIRARYLLAEIHANTGKFSAAVDDLREATLHGWTRDEQTCGCRMTPPPEGEMVRPLYSEALLLGGTFNLGNSLPSAMDACSCARRTARTTRRHAATSAQ